MLRSGAIFSIFMLWVWADRQSARLRRWRIRVIQDEAEGTGHGEVSVTLNALPKQGIQSRRGR